MYGEPFTVPEPQETVFISWFEGGEVFRSGAAGGAAPARSSISGPATKPTRSITSRRAEGPAQRRALGAQSGEAVDGGGRRAERADRQGQGEAGPERPAAACRRRRRAALASGAAVFRQGGIAASCNAAKIHGMPDRRPRNARAGRLPPTATSKVRGASKPTARPRRCTAAPARRSTASVREPQDGRGGDGLAPRPLRRELAREPAGQYRQMSRSWAPRKGEIAASPGTNCFVRNVSDSGSCVEPPAIGSFPGDPSY